MDTRRIVFRRSFLLSSGSAAFLAPMVGLASSAQTAVTDGGHDPWLGLKVGIASYTYSRLPLEAAIKGIQRVGVSFVSIKDAHLPIKSTPEERKAVAKTFREAGITPLSCGVITLERRRGGDPERFRVRARRPHSDDCLQADATRRCRSSTGWSRSSAFAWPFTITGRKTRCGRLRSTRGKPFRSMTSGSASVLTLATQLGAESIRSRRFAHAPPGSTTCT